MLPSAIRDLDPARRDALIQLIRYAIAGGAITLAVAASYWALAQFGGVDPMVSLAIVSLAWGYPELRSFRVQDSGADVGGGSAANSEGDSVELGMDEEPVWLKD